MKKKALIIVNPAAGRGKARKLLPSVRQSFSALGMGNFQQTEEAGEEERLTREALAQGVETIVVVGGDGTCTRVANVILKAGSDCALTVVPCGTGNDFAKTLGLIHYQPQEVAALVANGSVARIDVGRIDDNYFINSCGFGFDPAVLEATQKVRFLKGDAVYIYAALRQLLSYGGVDVSVQDDAEVKRGRMLMVTVSNGRHLGGAFRIAPRASVLDGKLDACFFGDSPVLERARLFAGALRGTHLGMRGVSSASVQELSLTFAAPPSMESDGELRTARSSTVRLECVPRALSVLAAPGALA